MTHPHDRADATYECIDLHGMTEREDEAQAVTIKRSRSARWVVCWLLDHFAVVAVTVTALNAAVVLVVFDGVAVSTTAVASLLILGGALLLNAGAERPQGAKQPGTRLVIDVAPEAHVELERHARETDRTVTELIRHALAMAVRKHPDGELLPRPLADDPTVPQLTLGRRPQGPSR